MAFIFLDEFGFDARLPGAYERTDDAFVIRTDSLEHGYLTVSEGLVSEGLVSEGLVSEGLVSHS
jgi:hypothetical protein